MVLWHAQLRSRTLSVQGHFVLTWVFRSASRVEEVAPHALGLPLPARRGMPQVCSNRNEVFALLSLERTSGSQAKLHVFCTPQNTSAQSPSSHPFQMLVAVDVTELAVANVLFGKARRVWNCRADS